MASAAPKETPPVASTRAYLRNGLPSLYQDGDFGMRFVGALEELLDPIVAVLDALPAHFDPNHAPRDILELLAAWLGVDLDETQDDHATSARWSAAPPSSAAGAAPWAGIELALQLHFPDVPLRVEDNGGVVCARTAGAGGRSRRELRRLLRQAGRRERAGRDRPLHRAVQAGAQHVPPAREGSEEEG